MAKTGQIVRVGLVLAVGLWALPGPAADKYWVGPDDNWWDYATNWSATPGGAGGAGQPADGESAYVTKDSATDYTVKYWNDAYPTAVHPYVVVDQTGAGAPTLQCPYSYPLTAETLYVGQYETGTVIQSAGIWTVQDALRIGRMGGATGHYQLQGGTLVCGGYTGGLVELGYYGTGVFTNSGGIHTIQATMHLAYAAGAEGTYVMNDDHGTPQLDSTDVVVGRNGSGLFQQYAGAHHATGSLELASGTAIGGTYELYGGSLQVDGNVTVGQSPNTIAALKMLGDATATVGGNISIGLDSGTAGELQLDDGTLTVYGNIAAGAGDSALKINDYNALDFQGSSITVYAFILGSTSSASGHHSTSAGEDITCAELHVGEAGSGSLSIESGGSLHCTGPSSFVGSSSGKEGVLSVWSGSSLTTDGSLYLGYQGSGHFYMYTGSAATINGSVCGAYVSGSESHSRLEGGTLEISGDLALGGRQSSPGGTAKMIVETGATVDVGGKLYIWPDAELIIAAGTLRMVAEYSLEETTGTITFGAGTVELTSTDVGLDTKFLDAVLGSGHALRNGQHLLCSGGGAVELRDELVLDGGTFSAVWLANPASLRFERGRFNKLGGNLTVGSAGLFGDALTIRSEQHYHAQAQVAVDVDGRLEMAGGRLSSEDGAIIAEGRICGDGIIDGYLCLSPGGEAVVEQGQALEFTSAAASVNHGQIILSAGTMRMAGGLGNAWDGNIMGRGTLVSKLLDNDGDIALSNGISDVRGDVLNDTTGRIFISGEADVTFWDDVTNNGTLFRCADGCTVTFFGSFGGSGVSGGGHVYLEDDLTPGSSPAAMDFGGDVTFGPLGRVSIELGGTAPGDEHDQVNVTGNASLDGTLAVSVIDGFEAAAGDEFVVMTYGALQGEFAEITGWEHDQLAHLAFYGEQALSLHATYFGDANLDGAVDGGDYTLWADSYGQPSDWYGGDFNGDGVADGGDYTLWADNYGYGTAAAVPEPGVLSALAVAALALIRRRRRS